MFLEKSSNEDGEKVDVQDAEVIGEETTSNTTKDEASSVSETPEQSSNASLGGWFTSIVQSAKDTVNKSVGTIESIKRDLNEFKDAIQIETMVSSTASVMKKTFSEINNTVNEIGSLGSSSEDDHIKAETSGDDKSTEEDKTSQDERKSSFNLETLNSFTNIISDKAKQTFGIVKETLVDSIFINRDYLLDELEDELYVNKNGEILPIENWKQLLHEMQIDSATYCREPSGPPEDYEAWLASFNLLEYGKQMEYLLENVPEIRGYYDELVSPRGQLSESDFWHRYYYRLYQLKEQQKRLILDVSSTNTSCSVSPSRVAHKPNESVDVKYLNEKADEWEKMGDNSVAERRDKKTKDTDRSSSDEDWVKCD